MRVSWSPRRIVRAQRIRKKRTFKGLASGLLLILLLALVHVGVRVAVVETGYEIRKLMDEKEALKGERHSLRVEVQTLRSPTRIEKVAKELKLNRPQDEQVTLISFKTP